MPASALLFLVIPIVFFIAVSQLTKAKGPQWLPYTFENPYNYLFNSLLLLKGQAPQCIDHPGTTVQVFGAIILRASEPGSNNDVIASAIRSPEGTIRKLHRSLLIFTVLILWLAPWITAMALRSYIAGLLIQAPTLFYQSLLFYGILFGPDLMLVPFSIIGVCCCALLMAPSAFPQKLSILLGIGDESASPGASRLVRIPLLAALTGLVCALGIVTKLTFFPLILISLVCCRSKRNVVTFCAAFVSGLALALLPIYSQLPRLATWIFNLGIHSGRYDSGPVGLPQASVYLSSVSNFLQDEPMVAIIPSVTIIVVLLLSFFPKGQKPTNGFSWPTALFLFVIQLLSFLVSAKELGVHYLIPLFLTTGLSLVFLFRAFRTSSDSLIRRVIGWTALTGLLAVGLKGFIELTPSAYIRLRAESADQLRLYQHAEEITKNDVRVDYFFSDSPEYPMCYGNDLAGKAFSSLLEGKYPNRLFFGVFNSRFETFTEFIEPKVVLQKYDHLYFLGNRNWFPKVDGLDPATFETIDHAGNYYLHEWIRR